MTKQIWIDRQTFEDAFKAYDSVATPEMRERIDKLDKELYDIVSQDRGFFYLSFNYGLGDPFYYYDNNIQTLKSMLEVSSDGRIFCDNKVVDDLQQLRNFDPKTYEESLVKRIERWRSVVVCGKQPGEERFIIPPTPMPSPSPVPYALVMIGCVVLFIAMMVVILCSS